MFESKLDLRNFAKRALKALAERADDLVLDYSVEMTHKQAGSLYDLVSEAECLSESCKGPTSAAALLYIVKSIELLSERLEKLIAEVSNGAPL